MTDLRKLHDISLPEGYMPQPGAHLTNERDCEHYLNSLMIASTYGYDTILDIGCYDGWLPLLLVRDGFRVTGIEFIPGLVQACRNYIHACEINNVEIIEGAWMDVSPPRMVYDLVTCYEVLEHVPMDDTPAWIDKMDRYGRKVSISLPDQKHEDNPQHRWTPSKKLIYDLFGSKKNLCVEYHEYKIRKDVPPNWYIRYDT